MRSSLPKVLHPIGSQPMLGHVLAAASASGAERVAVVVGDGADPVRAYIAKAAPDAAICLQAGQRGTADAVLAARKEIVKGADDVIVLYGDTPLVTASTLARMRRALDRGADIVVLGFRPADPGGYGRLIIDDGQLVAIREVKDASKDERAIGFCNAGIMAFAGESLLATLKKIGNDNAKGEFYLTDAVAIANEAGRKVVALEASADEVLGINARGELAVAERVFQDRARATAMAQGATLIAPETVWFSHDTKLGRDVTIEPNVFFGPGVTVADRVTIRANSHIEGAKIATGASIGPFARLRPGTEIGPKAKVGNFVETKNAVIDEGAKANHLSYIGDAHVGAAANIGAGAITCNYDGFDKFHTEIGEGAFIGSNSALVAPVTIGAHAYIATGSVITRKVAANALAVARGQQSDKPGWAEQFREIKRRSHNKPPKKRG